MQPHLLPCGYHHHRVHTDERGKLLLASKLLPSSAGLEASKIDAKASPDGLLPHIECSRLSGCKR